MGAACVRFCIGPRQIWTAVSGGAGTGDVVGGQPLQCVHRCWNYRGGVGAGLCVGPLNKRRVAVCTLSVAGGGAADQQRSSVRFTASWALEEQ